MPEENVSASPLLETNPAFCRAASSATAPPSHQSLWWDSNGRVQGNDSTQIHFPGGTMHGRCLRNPFRNLELVWWFDSVLKKLEAIREQRYTQSYFWSSCWCGTNDIKVFITQPYLLLNGSSILKLPLNVKKMEREEFTVLFSAKADFFFSLKEPHFSRCYFENVCEEQFFLLWFLESEFLLILLMVCQCGAAWMVFPIRRSAVVT